MRIFHRTAIFAVVLSSLLLAQEKPNIAVMELEGNGVSQTDLGGLSNRLRSELVKTGRFNVIERSRMDEILKEQGFQQTGCTNTDCAVEIGQLIGVQKIVLGSIDMVAGMYAVDIRMVDVGIGRIDITVTEDCEGTLRDVMKSNIHNAARKLAKLGGNEVTEKRRRSSQAVPKARKSYSYGRPEWERLGIAEEEYHEYKKEQITTLRGYFLPVTVTWCVPFGACVPGVGNVILKRYKRGFIIFGASAAVCAISIPMFLSGSEETSLVPMLVGTLGGSLFDTVDSILYTRKERKRVKAKYNISLAPQVIPDNYSLKLSCNF